jgi:hypothetical protein
MNTARNLETYLRKVVPNAAVAIALSIATSCTPTSTGPPAVQVTTGAGPGPSGWTARLYGNYEHAWASFTTPLTLEPLHVGDLHRSVVNGGYATTDSEGQAEMKYGPSCTVYTFQDSGAITAQETISTCPRGSGSTACTNTNTAWFVQNCPGISAVTLAATIVFSGTAVTILEHVDAADPKLAYVVVLVSEGEAIVTPADPNQPTLSLQASNAAYWVTPGFVQEGNAFFGFAPGTPVGLSDFVPAIQKMDQVRQMQRANLVLQSEALETIPLEVPYRLGLRWLDPAHDDSKVSQGLAQLVEWQAALPEEVPGYFVTQGQTIDLRTVTRDPGAASKQLETLQFRRGQAIVLAFDDTIPGLADSAATIGKFLSSDQWVEVRLVPFNPNASDALLKELRAGDTPALVLGGL